MKFFILKVTKDRERGKNFLDYNFQPFCPFPNLGVLERFVNF